MRPLRLGTPLWLAQKLPALHYPSLKGWIDADVAIVGGGLTGAAIASVFARAGVRIVLVESGLVGHGSTAANTALLMQEPDEDLDDLGERYGAGAARRIWQLSRMATRDFVRTLRRLHIACELAERDSVYYTTNPSTIRALRGEYQRRRAAGINAEWLDRTELRRITGINGGVGIRTSGNAQLNPYKACIGLLRSAERCGARVFERSAVRHIDPSRHDVKVIAAHGAIRAESVIIATGYATPAFKPLAGRFEMKHTYVLATKQIGGRARNELGLHQVMIWDTERPYHYARWTADGRLLLGGCDRPLAADRRRAFREGTSQLQQYFEGLLPALRHSDIDYAWEGLFAMTPDGLPYIGPHRRYPRHLFALGYGGNGMTFAYLAARLLLEHFYGRTTTDHQLFAFDRLRRRRQ